MSIGKVTIATDHSDATIQRYLLAIGESEKPAVIRRMLANAAAAAGAEAIVVGPGEVQQAQHDFPRIGLIVGLPDAANSENIGERFASFLKSDSFTVAHPVKIGFPVTVADGFSSVSFIEEALRRTTHLQAIAEPYFADDVALLQRAAVLRAIAALPRVVALKLDVDDPNTNARSYTNAAGTLPWFARSHGLDFETFFERVRVCVAQGCSGVIAGAAVWRSELPSLLREDGGSAAVTVMSGRIFRLRQLCTTFGDVVG